MYNDDFLKTLHMCWIDILLFLYSMIYTFFSIANMTYVTCVLYVLPIWCFTILRIPWPPHMFQIPRGHVAMDALEILGPQNMELFAVHNATHICLYHIYCRKYCIYVYICMYVYIYI